MPCVDDLRPDRESGVPLTTQLVWRLRSLIDRGELAPGAQLPSVRAAATAAEVNVNTVRAAYAKLEAAGLVRTEQGRGTFVAGPPSAGAAGERRRLQDQIARLEAELVSMPVLAPRSTSDPEARPRRARVLSLDELTAVRDMLDERVRALKATRAEIAAWLEAEADSEPLAEAGQSEAPAQTGRSEAAAEARRPAPSRRPGARSSAPRSWSPTLAGAHIRWTGAR